MANQITTTVEILCKSTCKIPCIKWAKKCAKIINHTPSRAKLTFSTKFSRPLHQLSHSPTTSIHKQSFPLFHNPYYYNY